MYIRHEWICTIFLYERRKTVLNKTIRKITASLALTIGLSTMIATNANASTHTVMKGETLSKIASSNGVSLQSVIANNPQIANINRIYVGQTVNIGATSNYSNGQQSQPTQTTQTTQTTNYSSNDLYLLAGLIQTEAGGEPYEGMVAVGEVVMNRVHSSSFPSTVSGVIYQSGQFASPRTPSTSAIAAAKTAMQRGNTGILYFYNPATSNVNLSASHQVVKRIGNHVFLR